MAECGATTLPIVEHFRVGGRVLHPAIGVMQKAGGGLSSYSAMMSAARASSVVGRGPIDDLLVKIPGIAADIWKSVAARSGPADAGGWITRPCPAPPA